jgi:gentisate 1,2-dioxygenase
MQNCPVCRHPKAVLDAYADQLDIPLMNMLALYFPRELKQKKKNINREVGLEEARMISGVDWRTPEERGETPTRATRPFTGANRDSSSKYDCILM